MDLTRNPRHILLLTATIKPPQGVVRLSRTDPQLRLNDYREALKYYVSLLGKGIDKIVFAENSMADISELVQDVEKSGKSSEVEFVVFDGLDYPPEFGRGFGELKLIDAALSRSTFLSQQHDQDVTWKITGRYIVRNLVTLIDSSKCPFDFYCNFRNFPHRWADMFLFAWTTLGYTTILKDSFRQVQEDSSGVSAEQKFRVYLDQRQLPSGFKLIRRFSLTPLIKGIRGYDNSNYAVGRDWRKYLIRELLRRLAPWLWI